MKFSSMGGSVAEVLEVFKGWLLTAGWSFLEFEGRRGAWKEP